MHDNDPDVLEVEKTRNLSKIQHKTSSPHHEDNAPGWNEHLASSSEASVKADRSTIVSTTELQEKTVKYVKNRHHAAEGESDLKQ
ncbi:hypothetical protein C8J56DRAFT_29515 [Mycena floridula]|nr:hypothetical protein C8J56DRAFT_29515 [Mycena floridula]